MHVNPTDTFPPELPASQERDRGEASFFPSTPLYSPLRLRQVPQVQRKNRELIPREHGSVLTLPLTDHLSLGRLFMSQAPICQSA